ncbi:unnamed protein product, partial [Pocillopora meandrina]
TQLYRAIHSYTGLYTAIHSYTGLYRAIHSYTGLYTAIHSYTGAVASQLNRHLREYKEHIEGHCTSLGLGISEAFDTRRLRELFVKEVSDNIEEYRDWMTTGVNGLEEVYKFSQDGFFANEVGDLCARATAKVLKIPIVIITALLQHLRCHSYHTNSLPPHPSTLHMIILGQATTMPQKVLDNCSITLG